MKGGVKLNILSFKEDIHLKFDAMSIVGDFNDYNCMANLMQKNDDTWSAKLNLAKGTYKYRFFVFGGLLLNDPNAGLYECDENNEIWSVLTINSKGDIVTPKVNAKPNLESRFLSGIVSSVPFQKHINNNVFDILNDNKVVATFEFGNINNLHSATVLWFQPEGNLFMSDDAKVESNEENENLQVHFWLDIKQLSPPLGMWRVMLLIDGLYITEDIFFVHNSLLEESNSGILI